MSLFGKPRNRWGWLRAGALAVMAALLAGAALAWGGIISAPALRLLELAAAALIAVAAAAWMEDHHHQTRAELERRRADEHASTAQSKAAIHALLENGLDGLDLSAKVGEALAGLDGKGRGALLLFLYEQGALRADSTDLDPTGLDFSRAEIHKAHLEEAALAGANFARARLDGAHLGRARLQGTVFTRALLRRAALPHADLTGSDLSAAHLEHADLQAADLRGANLRGAFFNHASLLGAAVDGFAPPALGRLDEAVLIETTLPDGRTLTNEKGKAYLRSKEISTLVDRL